MTNNSYDTTYWEKLKAVGKETQEQAIRTTAEDFKIFMEKTEHMSRADYNGAFYNRHGFAPPSSQIVSEDRNDGPYYF